MVPGSPEQRARAALEEKRAAAISIKSLDRAFTSGALFHWATGTKEARHRVDRVIKEREAAHAEQVKVAKAKHYARTSFVWSSDKYPADEGPWNQPLISGYRIAGTETEFKHELFAKLCADVIASGLLLQPNAGGEWSAGEGCANLLDAIERGASRIGHAIHALATPSTGLPDRVGAKLSLLGVATVAELMKKRKIVAEVCTIANGMVHSIEAERYGTSPLKLLLRAGVPVVLGSANAGMWYGGDGTDVHEQLKLALSSGLLKRTEAAEIMARSFEITRALPPEMKQRFINQARMWATSGEPLQALPKADMYGNLNGLLPHWWVCSQAEQQNVPCPSLIEEGAKWRDMREFGGSYEQRCAIIRRAGHEALPSQILAVAARCEQRNVRLIELSIEPHGDLYNYFRMCSAGRSLAYERHGVYVGFVVRFRREVAERETGHIEGSVKRGYELLKAALSFNQLWSASLDVEVNEGEDD
ncbi:hypothetical protein AB1Y20_005908 [Prymnesium parvum]|uniref:adenosine deaminase n=1 Tax=Prymnesium parvum TaxID=97485 RepID=A0AB34J3D6_PRYPA